MPVVEALERSFTGTPDHRIGIDPVLGQPSITAGWNCANGTLEAFADRIGIIPIFYWSDGKRLAVSDSIAELAPRLPAVRFDDGAVAAYLRLGYFIGDTTPLAGVRLLPPASRLVWDGRLAIRPATAEGPHLPFAGTRDDAIAEYQRLFAKAIAARIGTGPGRLPLSGGRDSRHILLELHRQGALPPAVVTADLGNSTDHRIAPEVARRLGVESIVVKERPFSFRDEAVKNRMTFFMASEHGWYLSLLDHLAGPLFDGLAGDVLSNGLYFNKEVARLIDRGDFKDAARRFIQCNGTAYLNYLSREARRRFSDDLALDLIAEEMARHRGAANPLQSFVFWNRTRRAVALSPTGIAGSRAMPVLPYTDPELMTFLFSLPHDTYGPPGFHDEVIATHYPTFADIGYATKIKSPKHLGVVKRIAYAANASARLLDPFTSPARILYYAGEVIARGKPHPLASPFARISPLLQAGQELAIER